MKNLKLLHLNAGTNLGGTETMLLRFLDKVNKTCFQVSIGALFNNGPLMYEVQKRGFEGVLFKIKNRWNLVEVLFAFLKVYRFLKLNKIDIIHMYGFYTNILGRIVARLAKTPIIITGIRIENFGYNGFHSFLERSTSGWVDLYISVSEQSRKLLLKQHWIPEEKVVVIHNGIDLNWAKLYTSQNVDSREKRIFPNGVTGGKRTTFFPARGVKTPIERGLGKIQIGMIAAFNHFKTQDSIVLAAPKILETFPNTKFVLVGEGKTKKRITELISQLGLNSNFLLPGFVNDVRQILSQLSIFVLASNSEGFPVSILEAMSFGIPIVTSKVGGIPELVQDGVTGILVEPNRSEVLASAIIELLANPEKANRMGEMGKLRVKKFFTIEKMMQELESHYLDLAKRKGLQ